MPIEVVEVQVQGPQGPPGPAGAGIGLPIFPYFPGTAMKQSFGNSETTVRALGNNAVFTHVTPNVPINKIYFNVTTASEGPALDFALYSSNHLGQPRDRLLVVENVQVNTTGLKTVQLDSPIVLSNYLLWWAPRSNSTSLRCTGNNNNAAGWMVLSAPGPSSNAVAVPIPPDFPEIIPPITSVDIHNHGACPGFQVSYA